MKYTCLLIFFFVNYCSYANEIAITFDDLPEATNGLLKDQMQINQRILSGLLKFKVPATGFVNEGKLYSHHEESQEKIALLKLWVDKGFDLGNHTYSHLSLSTLTPEQFKSEVYKGSQVSHTLMHDAGRNYRYFRHPYLDTGKTYDIRLSFENFLKDEGYLIAPVTIDTDDWKFNQQLLAHPEDKDKIILSYLLHTRAKFSFYEDASKTIFGQNIKQIWLLHVNLINSYAMEHLLMIAEEFHYNFINLDNALTDEAYQSEDNYYAPFGPSWLYRWDFTLGQVVDWSQEPAPSLCS